MPVPDMVYLSTPTDTSSTAYGVTGEIRVHLHPTFGMQYYRMIQNNRGSAIPAGQLCAFDTGNPLKVTLAGASTLAASCAGVAVVEIPNGHFGWVVCRGQVSADANGTTTAGELCRPVAGGQITGDATPSSSVEAAQIIGFWPEGSAGSGLKTAYITII
tara:strand:- start:594 stop:1070 length:477 start_codon:yes stop_codon:yes gene_type:complete